MIHSCMLMLVCKLPYTLLFLSSYLLERRMLRMIYGPNNEDGIWRTRYNNELFMLYEKLDIVKLIQLGRLW
jgi:hypothetical protein